MKPRNQRAVSLLPFIIIAPLVLAPGCYHRRVAENFGMSKNMYGGTTAAYQQGQVIYIEGVTLTKRYGDTDYSPSANYARITPTNREVVWFDAESIPDQVRSSSRLPFDDGNRMNMRAYEADFRPQTNPIVVYQKDIFIRDSSATNVIWIHYYPEGTTWRDESAYPEFYFAYTGAWIIDIVTAPIQGLGYVAGALFLSITGWGDWDG
jgi:hypothetical protein